MPEVQTKIERLLKLEKNKRMSPLIDEESEN